MTPCDTGPSLPIAKTLAMIPIQLGKICFEFHADAGKLSRPCSHNPRSPNVRVIVLVSERPPGRAESANSKFIDAVAAPKQSVFGHFAAYWAGRGTLGLLLGENYFLIHGFKAMMRVLFLELKLRKSGQQVFEIEFVR